MTKDEVSDLRSFVMRVIECEKAAVRATELLHDARMRYENFLHRYEHPEMYKK